MDGPIVIIVKNLAVYNVF